MTDDVLQFLRVVLVVRSAVGASLGAVDHLAVELVGFDLEIVEDLRYCAAQMLFDLAKQLRKGENGLVRRSVSMGFNRFQCLSMAFKLKASTALNGSRLLSISVQHKK